MKYSRLFVQIRYKFVTNSELSYRKKHPNKKRPTQPCGFRIFFLEDTQEQRFYYTIAATHLSISTDCVHIQAIRLKKTSNNRVRVTTKQIRSKVFVQFNRINFYRIVSRSDHQNIRITRPINPDDIIVSTKKVSSQYKAVVLASYFTRCLKNENFPDSNIRNVPIVVILQ